jgi:D-glycero-alpha-D-manno-heptose-7-phosphate kinase
MGEGNPIMFGTRGNGGDRTRTRIKCTAPIRICDLGGWTDTWFAGKGNILNIAVFPSVEVTVDARKAQAGEGQITIFAENYNDRYDIEPKGRTWTKHPLIEAALRMFELPRDLHLDVSIFSEAPAGASTGTSAAVSVALLGALDLLGGRSLTSHEIASKAHYIESELLGIQSGIQDQISSAYGGINFIEMTNYPEASVSPLSLPEELLWELQSRLVLIYLGKPHSSSAIHGMVIRRLEESSEHRRHLEPLREAAIEGKKALLRKDLEAFGNAMIENTRAQRKLHPDLIGERAKLVISLAQECGVAGYKVNGAGGAGGSITLLLKSVGQDKHELLKAIQKMHPEFRHIPMILAPQGLRRWSNAKDTLYGLAQANGGANDIRTKRESHQDMAARQMREGRRGLASRISRAKDANAAPPPRASRAAGPTRRGPAKPARRQGPNATRCPPGRTPHPPDEIARTSPPV